MVILFHGTKNYNTYRLILKHGFKKYTFFTKYLHSALSYGGNYIFAIWMKADPNNYWEWCTPKVIPAKEILYVKKFSLQTLFRSHIQEKRKRYDQLLDDNPGHRICTECDGIGEVLSKLCKNCRGHGTIH